MFGEGCAHLLNFYQLGPCWLSCGGWTVLNPTFQGHPLRPHFLVTRAGLPSPSQGERWLLSGRWPRAWVTEDVLWPLGAGAGAAWCSLQVP